MKYEYKSIKEIPEDFRPREKMWKYGPSNLSDAELIAIILGSGTKGEDVISLSRKISNMGWSTLKEISLKELASIKGIGKVKASQIKALVELAERINNPFGNTYIRSPKDAYGIVKDYYDNRKEVLVALYLDINYRLTDREVIAVGSLNRVFSQPKDILYKAVSTGSYGIIIAHNHPTAESLKPSKDDIKFTSRVKEACSLLGFELVDHIIFNEKDFISMKSLNLL